MGGDLQALLQAAKEMSESAEAQGAGWGDEDPFYADGASIRRADHTIKVLTPLLLAASSYIDVQANPDNLDAMLTAALTKANRDADTMLTAIDVPPDTAPSWLVQHLRGELSREIAAGVARNNAHATREGTEYLMPLIDHLAAMQDAGQMSEHNRPFASNSDAQLDAELARACSRVLMEYQRFNYFHTVAHKVSDLVRDTIQGRVLDGTLAALTEDFRLNENERRFVGISLVQQAGEVLAHSWNSNVGHARDLLAQMQPAEAKEARAKGLPLNFVIDDFETQYAATELAMASALESMIPQHMVNKGALALERMGGVFAEAQRLQSAPEGVDPAIRAVSHGVKVLSPILMAASRQMGEHGQSAELNTLIQGTMGKVARDSTKLLAEAGVAQGEAPVWLISHVRGVLTQAIAASVAKQGGYTPADGDDLYLDALMKHSEHAMGMAAMTYEHMPAVTHNLKMGTALAQATSRVMSEYQQFSYFHPDARSVAALVSEKLRDTAYDGTLQRMKVAFNLSQAEADYLGVTLLHHAGEMQANAWAANIEACNEVMARMQPSELRSVRANGMPLDSVFDEFDSQYSGVEISVQSGLEHMLGERMRPDMTTATVQKKSNAAGMR